MKETKTRLKDCELYKEKDEYFLRLKYESDRDNGLYEIEMPKVALCIPKDHYCINHSYHADEAWPVPSMMSRLVCHSGVELPVYADGTGVYAIEKLIKKKVKKMTVKEIEEKLGYSIEIVSEK